MSDKKIQVFKTEVAAGQYDVDEKFMNFLIACIQKAGLDKAEIVTQTITAAPSAAAATTVYKTKKLTGYNIFMKEKMAEFKAKNMPVAERMGEVSKAWKALTDEQKAAWKVKADKEDPVVITAKAQPAKKGPKSMTGYQFFVKEQMPIVKAKKEILAKDRLTELGKMWKALNEKDHAAYKAKAATVSPPPVKA